MDNDNKTKAAGDQWEPVGGEGSQVARTNERTLSLGRDYDERCAALRRKYLGDEWPSD